MWHSITMVRHHIALVRHSHAIVPHKQIIWKRNPVSTIRRLESCELYRLFIFKACSQILFWKRHTGTIASSFHTYNIQLNTSWLQRGSIYVPYEIKTKDQARRQACVSVVAKLPRRSHVVWNLRAYFILYVVKLNWILCVQENLPS